MLTQVAIIYRKFDGAILRVSTMSAKLAGKITEEDVHLYMPGIDDLDDFRMVFVQGKQYLDIDKFKVETDVNGDFVDIVEKADILTSFEDDKDINVGLLDREAEVVITVLEVLNNDKERLAKYKVAEQRGQNRSEVMNFFREKGV